MKPIRTLSALALATALAVPAALPAAAKVSGSDRQALARISKHFSGVPTMMGEFIQFGPNGEQTGGKFYLSRPGKIRFDYTKPSPILVKANGKTVGIHNRKLKTWDFFPLSKTPLKLLLDKRIDPGNKAIRSVKREKDLTTVVLADRSVFGDSRITMMFDPASSELRQWTITDDQGKDTSVMIFNVKRGVKLGEKLFRIDERAIRQRQGANGRLDP